MSSMSIGIICLLVPADWHQFLDSSRKGRMSIGIVTGVKACVCNCDDLIFALELRGIEHRIRLEGE